MANSARHATSGLRFDVLMLSLEPGPPETHTCKVLVTGGARFIGENFVRHCLKDHPGVRLVVLDALTYASKVENLHAVADCPSLHFVHSGIPDQGLVEGILRDERLDTLVHFAAQSHVARQFTGVTNSFIRIS